MKEKCCKHICVNCKNFEANIFVGYSCHIIQKQKIDCVDGHTTNVHLVPEKANKNGDCKHYEEDVQRVLWNEIQELLEEYNERVFMQYYGDYTGWNEYRPMKELLDVLEKPRKWVSNEDTSEEKTKQKKGWWDAYRGLMSRK